MDLDISINKQKSKKNLDNTNLWFLFDFLSMKTDAYVHSKSNQKKTLEKTYILLVFDSHWREKQDQNPDPKVSDMNPQTWIRTKMSRIHYTAFKRFC